MKSFFEDPNAVPFVILPLFTFVFIILIGGSSYLDNHQRFVNYQKALDTIVKCRSSNTNDMDAIFIDNTCGKVPTPEDFGLVSR